MCLVMTALEDRHTVGPVAPIFVETDMGVDGEGRRRRKRRKEKDGKGMLVGAGREEGRVG